MNVTEWKVSWNSCRMPLLDECVFFFSHFFSHFLTHFFSLSFILLSCASSWNITHKKLAQRWKRGSVLTLHQGAASLAFLCVVWGQTTRRPEVTTCEPPGGGREWQQLVPWLSNLKYFGDSWPKQPSKQMASRHSRKLSVIWGNNDSYPTIPFLANGMMVN